MSNQKQEIEYILESQLNGLSINSVIINIVIHLNRNNYLTFRRLIYAVY